jgi:hypothetical protein
MGRLTVANPHRVNKAILLLATAKDSYRSGDKWVGVGDKDGNYINWQYGRTVEAVAQFMQSPHAIGDEMEILDLQGRVQLTGNINGIKMIVCADITDEDIALLGYKDRAEWIEQTEGFPERRGWLILLSEIDKRDASGAAWQDVIDVKTTNAETGEVTHTPTSLRGGDKIQ